MKKRIAITDDHNIVREGLEMLLSPHYGSDNISTYSTGGKLLKALEDNVFDLIILDIQLPDLMAFSLLPIILKTHPNQKVIIFSMYPEKTIAQAMFDLGAMGYVNKKADNSEILKAIRTVLEGQRYMSDQLKIFFSNKFLNRESSANPIDNLSNREREVLMLLLQGQGILEIGNLLGLNSSTIATYKSRIFEKMAVTNVIELYNKGIALGLT